MLGLVIGTLQSSRVILLTTCVGFDSVCRIVDSTDTNSEYFTICGHWQIALLVPRPQTRVARSPINVGWFAVSKRVAPKYVMDVGSRETRNIVPLVSITRWRCALFYIAGVRSYRISL